MLSLNPSPFHAALSRTLNVNKPNFLGSGLQPFYFPFENGFPFNHWVTPVKDPALENGPQQASFEITKQNDFKHTGNVQENIAQEGLLKPCSSTQLKESNQSKSQSDLYLERSSKESEAHKVFKSPSNFHFPCRVTETQMNGSEKLTMTGSSNPRTEQLTWISDIASKSASNQTSTDGDKLSGSAPPVLHNVNDNSSTLLLPNSGALFCPPLVVARPSESSNSRMFTPPFQAERVRHSHRASVPLSGTGTSLYYSQAPRTTPYSNFFHPTYPSTATYLASTSQSVTNTSSTNTSESTRPYLQVDSYSTLPGLGSTLQSIGTSHSQRTCSPGYLQHPATSSPTSLIIPPSSSHTRLFQQGRSILISRSPEGMIVHSPHERDPSHVRVQLSPTLPQLQEETTCRKSYASVESVLGSLSCSPVTETIQNTCQSSDFSGSKDFSGQRSSVSPSHVGYRVPTGKEGSLKHRILRPPSISIVDPPPSVVADAPLSAPPIRSHREPSPKQVKSNPSSAYRSFSSSASTVAEVSLTNRVLSAHASLSSGSFPNNCSSLSSGSASPAPPNSPSSTAQLKYPQSFMKGSIIQLANNQLKQVEYLTTEDFIECGSLSPTLKIDSSTVVSIEKTPSTGAAKLGFHVGQNSLQINVEAPLEHPFFVYKQGWSSCSPERSLQRYGLRCHKLKVGDVCISLTEKRITPNNSQKTVEATSQMPCPSVPTSLLNPSVSNQNLSLEGTVVSNEKKGTSPSQTFRLPLNYTVSEKQLPGNNTSRKQSMSVPSTEKSVMAQSEIASSATSGKRKRRWSAPDNLSQNEEAPSSSS